MKKYMILAIFSLLLVGCGGSAPADAPTGELKEFTVAVRNFEFEPATITVNQGDTVKLTFIGEDDGSGSGHGVAIPIFGVSQVIRDGETHTVEFVADKKGTHPFFCSVFCGDGHGQMKGSLIVQ